MGSKYLFNDLGRFTLHMTNIVDVFQEGYGTTGNGSQAPRHQTHFYYESQRSNMNEYILKMIVGHEIADITEKIYSPTVEDLKEKWKR